MKNYLPLFLQHQDAITIEIEEGLEISLDDGAKRFRLNGTAKRVWELTANPVSLEDIVKNIHHIYREPSSSHTRDEILQFLDDATRYGLILQLISKPEL